ncbi:MAG: hypothetical protein WBD78_01860 [Methylocella sp.]
MAPKLRRTLFGTVIALLVAAGPVAFLVYFLPHHEVLRIVGSETRRPLGSSKSDTTTHDVIYIYAEDLETKNPVCFTTKALAWVSFGILNSIRPNSSRSRNPLRASVAPRPLPIKVGASKFSHSCRT